MKFKPIFVIFSIIMVACAQRINSPGLKTNPSTNTSLTSSPNSTLISTIQPSSTVAKSTIPTLTIIPTREPITLRTQDLSPSSSIKINSTTEPIDWNSVPSCRNGNQNYPDNSFRLPGVLSFFDFEKNGYYAIGGSSLYAVRLPISGTISNVIGGFSPDGNWLAYKPPNPSTIGLLSKNGNMIEKLIDEKLLGTIIPKDTHLCGWTPYDWINDNLIPMAICYYVVGSNRINYDFMILDPFTGNWQLDMLSRLPYMHKNSRASFSPDLSRALYNDSEGNLILWDNKNSRSIQIDPSPIDEQIFWNPFWPDLRSAWSSNSSLVAITASETEHYNPSQRGVYILGKNGGESRKITDFIQQFETFQAYHLQWSRDNRFLAFAVNHYLKGDYKQSIYVYDTINNDYIFQCELSQTEDINIRWSPDNKFIAYTGETSSPLVVIDLITGEKLVLSNQAIISDWTNNLEWLSQ